MERLEIPASTTDAEEAVKALITNAKTLQAGLDRVGFNLLKYMTSSTAQAIGVTETSLTDFQCSVRTSGGLLIVLANIYMSGITEAHESYLRLYIDDVMEGRALMLMTAAQGTMVPVFAVKELNAGQHTVKLKGACGSASGTYFGDDMANSTLHVVELLRG